MGDDWAADEANDSATGAWPVPDHAGFYGPLGDVTNELTRIGFIWRATDG